MILADFTTLSAHYWARSEPQDTGWMKCQLSTFYRVVVKAAGECIRFKWIKTGYIVSVCSGGVTTETHRVWLHIGDPKELIIPAIDAEAWVDRAIVRYLSGLPWLRP